MGLNYSVAQMSKTEGNEGNSLIYSVQSVTKFVKVHENFLLSENNVDSTECIYSTHKINHR